VFRRVEPARTATFTTHGVAPGVVLGAFEATFGRAPPPAFELAIRGESFGLGEPLGERARLCLEEALAFFAVLRGNASVVAWQGAVGGT